MATTREGRGSGYPATKSREFICEECNARCTRGLSGTEYGHKIGCPGRPEHFPESGGGGSYVDDWNGGDD